MYLFYTVGTMGDISFLLYQVVICMWCSLNSQCAIPVFEGLLPDPHDKILSNLLFELSTWHAFAKLRLHTESTINALDDSTTRLGVAFRQFVSVTCGAFNTRELPSEEAARGRRKAALAAKGKGVRGTAEREHPRIKRLSLSTYKFHALGSYVRAIRMYGPTDNYSTQPVSALCASVATMFIIS
jgi:hypothetical protein